MMRVAPIQPTTSIASFIEAPPVCGATLPQQRHFSAPARTPGARRVTRYRESGVRPNTLVRFDPRSERGGGAVRNAAPGRDGKLAPAESWARTPAPVSVG